MRLANPSPAGSPPDLPALARALSASAGGHILHEGRSVPVSARALADLAVRLPDVVPGAPFQLLYETPLVVEVEGPERALLQIGADGAFRDARWHGFLAPRSPHAVLVWLASAGVPEPLARFVRWNGAEGDSAYSRFCERAPAPFQPIARTVRETPVGNEVAAARAELEKGSGVGGFLRRLSGGGRASAIEALLAWYGDREAPLADRPPYEELPRLALSAYGLQEVLDVFPRLSDAAALRGAGRFVLVPEVSPSMLAQYAALPERTRESMLAAWSASPADAAALKERVFPGAFRAPAGTSLWAMSRTSRFQSVAARGATVVAIDGNELVRLDGRDRALISMVPMPGIVAFLGEELWLFYGGTLRVLGVGGEVIRSQPAPAPAAQSQSVDALRARWPERPGGRPLVPPEEDLRAFAAFSGAGAPPPPSFAWAERATLTPSGLSLSTGDGKTQSVALPGEPGKHAATAGELVLLAHAGERTHAGWIALDGSAVWTAPLPISGDRVSQVIPVERGALLRMAAGAGEALVRVEPPAR